MVDPYNYRLIELGRLCKKYDVPHIVNNAYGIQSNKCMNIIEEVRIELTVYYDIISNMIKAHRQSRVDAFIQSTDKNFLVPVGGSVVVSCNESFIREVAQTYPGKSPI